MDRRPGTVPSSVDAAKRSASHLTPVGDATANSPAQGASVRVFEILSRYTVAITRVNSDQCAAEHLSFPASPRFH
jgi:hypothetical protein